MSVFILAILAILPVSASANDEYTCDLDVLIQAIDVPLSHHNLALCGATTDRLLDITHDAKYSVYSRARAVSALAHMGSMRSETALQAIAFSHEEDVIRDQSLRSLLAVYQADKRPIDLSFLMELLPSAGPRLTQTIQRRLVHLNRHSVLQDDQIP